MRILSIESSCDETSIAITNNGIDVQSCIISSQADLFKKTGGVIPELSARKQLSCVLPVLHEALQAAKSTWDDIDLIAVTAGPGLTGSLLIGTVTARTLAFLHHKPLLGVHHTLGHLTSPWLDTDIHTAPCFPHLVLSVSGGHTDLWYRTSHTKGVLLGRTRDDAAGEAFDKGAVLLGLPYPGGPAISALGAEGNCLAYPFPRPLHQDPSFDFSFSGLKTSLRYLLQDLPKEEIQSKKADLAASYEYGLCKHLVSRVIKAQKEYPTAQQIHLVGGVSANRRLRTMIQEDIPIPLCTPTSLQYCTDNAAMIGAAAYFLLQEHPNCLEKGFTTRASMPLEDVFSL